ncbi:hypothetical protein KCP78_14735 [Salmonella enterica subsp. enterica]|nr:hypothetical protein KCP78_14735 [Salmonella enterica subsp. enterica]
MFCKGVCWAIFSSLDAWGWRKPFHGKSSHERARHRRPFSCADASSLAPELTTGRAR